MYGRLPYLEALDSYFRQQIKQDVARRIAAAFVLTPDGRRVAGFYTLSSLSLLGAELPELLAKKLPSRAPIGVTLLERMAVSEELKGRQLGRLLLMHALSRALLASRQVASWAVVVDAKLGAREFYLMHDFLPLPSLPDRLFLSIKMIGGGLSLRLIRAARELGSGFKKRNLGPASTVAPKLVMASKGIPSIMDCEQISLLE